MQAYHTHSMASNIYTSFKDSAIFKEDLAKRAVELGQKVLSSVEHGYQGANYPKTWKLARQYGLKYVHGAEAYWVNDRKQADRSNGHIILLAKTQKGVYDINELMSEASMSGFYGVPRVDIGLLMALDPKDVFVTTACVAYWGKIDKETDHIKWHYGKDEDSNDESYSSDAIINTTLMLWEHFRGSFYLEVQCHNTTWQKQVNELCLKLHYQYGIPLIAGTDSHYIAQDQIEERRALREESGVHAFDEDHEINPNVYEDYPDEQTFFERFKVQGILNASEIQEAISNTDVILEFDDIEFDDSRKLPTIHPELTQEERNELYLKMVYDGWNEYKKNVPLEKWDEYEDAIAYETNIVTSTNMSDYFLLDAEMIKLGQEYGGKVTPTGRGSAGSFITNMFLKMTTLDRMKLPVKLYAERFVTADRLKTSCPDVDVNVSNPVPFVKAQEDLLGEGHIYPFISYGTLKAKAAFKMYARAKDIPPQTANEISQQIALYEKAYANADDDEKDTIVIEDFVDAQYIPYIEGSKPYLGIIVSRSQAPCGYMLYNGDIKREVGILRVNADGGKKVVYCTVLDGYCAEEFGYVKNDILTVLVVDVNSEVMKRAGLPQYSSSEIIDLTEHDKVTWDIFEKGYTQGINQCQSVKTTEKLMTYKPKCLMDLSAFVAAVRPGFKSFLQRFLNRQKFSYGIAPFDDILKNDTSGSSWMLYQENIMSVLFLAGFTMEESYPVIKAISKKKIDKIKSIKDRFIDGFSKYIINAASMNEDKAKEQAETVWQVIEDSSAYAFNACVSGSTRFYKDANGKFNPTIEEMYRIMHDKGYAENTHHTHLHDKYKNYGYGGVYSMYDDERCKRNEIVDIRMAGTRKTYRITTEHGGSVVCTDNHKFPTPYGKKRCDELSVGDELYMMGKYEKNITNYRFTDGNFTSNVPRKGQKGFQKNPNGNSVKFNAFRKFAVENKCPCYMCGKQYSENERFEAHHRDMDRCNNESDNLLWLCVSCHKKIHYKNGRCKRGEKGFPTYLSKITSIEALGEEMTYDVEMEYPAHNFVLDNGLITSNSHSVSVALDAIYGAYLKAHYPYEYYGVLLEKYTAKGNKKKVTEIKAEMSKAFGISVIPCLFREDNRDFRIDKTRKGISDALHSAKGISKQAANILYQMRNEKFNSFTDVLYRLENEPMIKKDQVLSLIKLGYFKEFGMSGKLVDVYNLFYGSGGFKKTLVEETQKKRLTQIYRAECELNDYEIHYIKQIKFEQECYGMPISKFPQSSSNEYIVIETDTKYSPKISLYSLKTGKSGVVKIKKETFKRLPLNVGDVIHVVDYDKRPAYQYMDGKAIKKPGVFELWLRDYSVIAESEGETN